MLALVVLAVIDVDFTTQACESGVVAIASVAQKPVVTNSIIFAGRKAFFVHDGAVVNVVFCGCRNGIISSDIPLQFRFSRNYNLVPILTAIDSVVSSHAFTFIAGDFVHTCRSVLARVGFAFV